MTDRLYSAVQTEGTMMRIIHLSTRLAITTHDWVSRDDLRADMPTLLHQLFAAHPGVRQLYLGTHYIGFMLEEDIWIKHLEQVMIDIILDSCGLDHHRVTQVSYNYYKVVCMHYVLALRDEKLFALT